MAFNFDSCSTLAASKSSIFVSTASSFASVSGISARCFALDLVSLADIRLSTIDILKKLSDGHSKAINDNFLENVLERARSSVRLAWRHHVTPQKLLILSKHSQRILNLETENLNLKT